MTQKTKLRPSTIVMLSLMVVVVICGSVTLGQQIPENKTPDTVRALFGFGFIVIGLIGVVGLLCNISWSEVYLDKFDKQFEEEIDKRVNEKISKIIKELNK